MKLCECGCGRPTPVQKQTHNDQGLKRGEQSRFLKGHHRRVHGMRCSVEYGAYNNALRRCTDSTHKEWKNYGGRGIKFLFTSFQQFFDELGLRPSGKAKSGFPLYSLDRKETNGHYEPGNVRWATRLEQNRNRRPINVLRSSSDEALLAEVRRRNLTL
jgi:hypothetical protein